MRQNNGIRLATTVPQTNDWVAVGTIGFIQKSRIVGVSRVKSAPIRRLIQATPTASIVVLTGGERRQTAVLLDSGHVIITALSLSEWQALLKADESVKGKNQ